jgi:hypothetical protein
VIPFWKWLKGAKATYELTAAREIQLGNVHTKIHLEIDRIVMAKLNTTIGFGPKLSAQPTLSPTESNQLSPELCLDGLVLR